MADIKDLQELASQLRKPAGAKGIEISEMMNETNIRMTYHSIDRLDIQEGNTILELGHGSCAHLNYLMQKACGLRYCGFEISELMYEEAQRINHKFIKEKQAGFYLYDGRKIPFSNDYFDRIFTVNTIYFWENSIELLFELYRILKSEGLLNITFAQQSFMNQLPFTQFGFELYDSDKLLQLVGMTSFEIVSSDSQIETVKSKRGDMVQREFTTITLRKK